jgi:hypothetical protein
MVSVIPSPLFRQFSDCRFDELTTDTTLQKIRNVVQSYNCFRQELIVDYKQNNFDKSRHGQYRGGGQRHGQGKGKTPSERANVQWDISPLPLPLPMHSPFPRDASSNKHSMQRTKIAKGEPDMARLINVLNKVTYGSYIKLIDHVVQISKRLEVNATMNKIFQAGKMQPCYNGLFCDMMRKIAESTIPPETVFACVSAYVTSFIDKFDYITSEWTDVSAKELVNMYKTIATIAQKRFFFIDTDFFEKKFLVQFEDMMLRDDKVVACIIIDLLSIHIEILKTPAECIKKHIVSYFAGLWDADQSPNKLKCKVKNFLGSTEGVQKPNQNQSQNHKQRPKINNHNIIKSGSINKI